MKKFVASFLFVLIGVFGVDRIGGVAMWWVNQHTHDVSSPKIKYLVNDVHEDIVLMGTSRCNLHYVPSIISDTLGMSVYNGGIDASYNIYAHYIMLNHILARHTPKVICLEVMTSDFVKDRDPFNTIGFFAPYFGLNSHADSVFIEAGKYWQYKISYLYRYNAKAVSNIAGLAINRQAGNDNGYIPNPKPAHFPEILEKNNVPEESDPKKLEYIQRFINQCQQKDIKLIFMVSPMYSVVDARHYDVLKSIARENGIPFMDYHTTGLYLDHPEYFKDWMHLWDKGARLFSSVFAIDLKRILESRNSDTPLSRLPIAP